MNAHNEQQWPEYLMLRDTGLYDDAGGLGQHIFTTAGAGYVKQKYVRADLAAQPSPVVKQNLTTQPAAAQESAPWRDHDAAIDAKALSTATEIALMWGQDRSQFISRIQVAVIDAMRWVKGGLQTAAAQEAAYQVRRGIGEPWKECDRAAFDVVSASRPADARKLYAAPVTAAPAELIERCKEILAWQRTGVLPGDALRAYANARWPDEHDPLQIAEKETAREALRILAKAAAASTPAAPGIDLLNTAYFQGWVAASGWAGRNDLVADDGSKAYTDERDQRLHGLIDASPKVALNEQFGSAEGLGGSEAAHADGWRVIPHTSPWRDGERWEVYGPNGGGSVNAGDIKDPTVCELLDALAGVQAGDAEVQP